MKRHEVEEVMVPSFHHTLELTDDEAFHIWLLSFTKEEGGDFPDGVNTQRVVHYFNRETYDRFDREHKAGRGVVPQRRKAVWP